MSCSGGEASLMADAIGDRQLVYPSLSTEQQAALREALGPMVALANPLDYHTYIWNAMTFLVIDFPRSDTCEDDSWWVAIEALLAARDKTAASVAVLATLPENLPESVADKLMQNNRQISQSVKRLYFPSLMQRHCCVSRGYRWPRL